MEISAKEQEKYVGGAVTASLVNAVTGLIKIIYNIGQNLGSNVRRLISGTQC